MAGKVDRMPMGSVGSPLYRSESVDGAYFQNAKEGRLRSLYSLSSTDHDLKPVIGDCRTGLHEWTTWRTRLNNQMIDVMEKRNLIFSYPNSVRILSGYKGIMDELTEPEVTIERNLSDFALNLAVGDYITAKEGFNLHADAFLSFGLPRVKTRFNTTYISPTKGVVKGGGRPSLRDARPIRRRLRRFEVSDEETTRENTVVIVSSLQQRPSIDHDAKTDPKKKQERSMESLIATMDLNDDE